MDHLLFDVPPAVAGLVIRQLDPALCRQIRSTPDTELPDGFQSSIQKMIGVKTPRSPRQQLLREFNRLRDQIFMVVQWSPPLLSGRARRRSIAFR